MNTSVWNVAHRAGLAVLTCLASAASAAPLEPGSRYLHESGVFSVAVTAPVAESSRAGVRFTHRMPFAGSISGWDEVNLVKPELSAGRSAAEVVDAIVSESSDSLYRSIRRAKNRPQASLLESAAAEAAGRDAWYAKVRFPRLPGTGMTVFGDDGRQVDADFVAFLHLVPVADLELLQNDRPVEYLLVSSFRAEPTLNERDVSHATFVSNVRLAPAFARAGYRGRYGFSVNVPDGHLGYAEPFSMRNGEAELLFIFPEGTPPEALQDEAQFGPLGIVRLEAIPRQRDDRRLSLDFARETFIASLVERGETFEEAALELAGPAFQLSITAPLPLVQVVIETSDLLFVITGGRDDDVFRDILASLQSPVAAQ